MGSPYRSNAVPADADSGKITDAQIVLSGIYGSTSLSHLESDFVRPIKKLPSFRSINTRKTLPSFN